MSTTTTELEKVYDIQQFGTKTKLHMEILLDVGRELTDVDKRSIRDCAEKLQELLNQETVNVNPQSKLDAQQERKEILELFTGRDIFVEEIPNGYCSSYCCKHLPWFVVTTKRGKITIGWRKRVININWEGSTIEQQASDLFPNEDVTKYDRNIHAWGLEKAKEYIDVLLNSK